MKIKVDSFVLSQGILPATRIDCFSGYLHTVQDYWELKYVSDTRITVAVTDADIEIIHPDFDEPDKLRAVLLRGLRIRTVSSDALGVYRLVGSGYTQALARLTPEEIVLYTLGRST